MKQWMGMEKMGKADKAKGKVVSVVNGGVVCRIIATVLGDTTDKQNKNIKFFRRQKDGVV